MIARPRDRCLSLVLALLGSLPCAAGALAASEPDTLAANASELQTGVAFRWHTIAFTSSANDEDIFIGATYRIRLTREANVGLQSFASFRPTDNRTLERLRPNFFIQRNESYRNLYGLTLDGTRMIASILGVYAGVGGSYSHGSYAGTSTDPGSGWSWVGEAGAMVQTSSTDEVSLAFRIGYRRADRFLSGNHMGVLSVGVEL